METNIILSNWFYNSIDGDNAVVNDTNGFLFESPDKETGIAICKAVNYTYGKGINPALIPDIIRENEELKARCETYKKDYDSMVKEVLRLSGENSKMREMIGERIKELEKE